MLKIWRFGYLQGLWWMALLFRDSWQSVGVILLYWILEFNFGDLSRSSKRYLQFSLLITLFGVTTESIIIATGWVSYGTQWFPPLWLIIFWPMFVGYYDWAFDHFFKRKWLACLFASVAGPFVYYGVSQEGAIDFIKLEYALMYLSLSWALFFPLSLVVYEKLRTKSLGSGRP